MLDLRLVQLRHFLLVVETKSYRTAAERSFRSQPALSQSIRQLETRLGQPLFEKASRTTLTPFGERCLPVIRELVAHIERSTAGMSHLGRGVGGLLRIAILPSIAGQWLSPLLMRFVADHPEVRVQVMAEDSRVVHRLVATGDVDFGISSLYETDASIDFTPLLRDRFGLLCPAGHRHVRGDRTLAWDEIGEEPVIGNVMHRMLVDTPVWKHVEHPRIHVSNLPTLLTLVRDGFGVTPIPALACPAGDPSLAFVPLRGPVLQRTIGLMTRSGRTLLPAADAMVALIHEHLRHAAWQSGTFRRMKGMIDPVRGARKSAAVV